MGSLGSVLLSTPSGPKVANALYSHAPLDYKRPHQEFLMGPLFEAGIQVAGRYLVYAKALAGPGRERV